MKRALVIGATGGIGHAVAAELERRDVEVTRRSRSEDGFEVTDEARIEAGLADLEGTFDLIFVATGALKIDGNGPEKSLRQLNEEALVGQFRANAVGPALVLKHARRLLPRKERAVFVALSARVGSIGDNGLGGWYSYRTAKAALNQLMHGAAIELGRSHRSLVVACLHPGTVETGFTQEYPDHDKVGPERAAERLVDVVETLTPEHSGGFYDYAGKEIPW